ncbi:YCII-related protein [Penicillium chrysogenum]|uniref:YCII-related protein n=1 Tax=Penicillium chrysogenum TaxID=5076 RepID=A0ABQ8W6P8_PENCH|nr:YCII-related protein [Penicillium chrysogenum]KAJ5237415.1 YCII-related protein [Penicillium chrysogenum]KAJ5256354.1 YCII-related protein [Penicillium chrysogenum]KAJ5277374.1 YCII-related protein [Penicillium chrysogenum]KAJ6151875.1 YCII-related protein [Penicillium chrysogenum]
MSHPKLIAGGAIFEEQTEESEVALFKGSVVIYSGNVLKAAPSSRKMFTPLVFSLLLVRFVILVFYHAPDIWVVRAEAAGGAGATSMDTPSNERNLEIQARHQFRSASCAICHTESKEMQ